MVPLVIVGGLMKKDTCIHTPLDRLSASLFMGTGETSPKPILQGSRCHIVALRSPGHPSEVDEYNAVRMKLTAEMADSANLVKVRLRCGVSFWCVCYSQCVSNPVLKGTLAVLTFLSPWIISLDETYRSMVHELQF